MGFILLVTGVILALFGHVQIGTVTGAGGVLVEGAAGLIFNQANKAKSDAQSNLTSIALATSTGARREPSDGVDLLGTHRGRCIARFDKR